MYDIAPEVAENYRVLREERGLTWEQLAQHTNGDRNLAAWMRSQDQPEVPRQRTRTRRTNEG